MRFPSDWDPTATTTTLLPRLIKRRIGMSLICNPKSHGLFMMSVWGSQSQSRWQLLQQSSDEKRERESTKLWVYVRWWWIVGSHDGERPVIVRSSMCTLQSVHIMWPAAAMSRIRQCIFHVERAFVRFICIVNTGSRFCVYPALRSGTLKAFRSKVSSL